MASEFEKGLDRGQPMPVDPNGLPRGVHQIVPPVATFQGQNGMVGFSQYFDEALRDSRENAYRMRFDPMISTCLNIRACAVSLLDWSIEPENPEDDRESEAAEEYTKSFHRLPRKPELFRWLLKEGLFVGRAGAQVQYKWVPGSDGLLLEPYTWSPLNGDKLAFSYDGRVGIACRPGSELITNSKQIQYLDGSPVYFCTQEERDCLVVHRAYTEDADFYRPWYGGQIYGSGYRNALYWLWILKSQMWAISIDYLRFFAKGLTLCYYEYDNPADQAAVAGLVNSQASNNVWVWPRRMKGGEPMDPNPVEHIDVSTAPASFIQELLTNYFDDMIRFSILWQSLTTTTKVSGLGGNEAEAHMGTNETRIAFDAAALEETMTADFLRPWYRANRPTVRPAKFKFTIDSPNVQQMMESAQTIVGIGGSVPQQPMLEAAGIPVPGPKDTILGGIQPNQPAAVTSAPTGMPQIGAPTQPVGTGQ